jgi:hypothetical protein
MECSGRQHIKKVQLTIPTRQSVALWLMVYNTMGKNCGGISAAHKGMQKWKSRARRAGCTPC